MPKLKQSNSTGVARQEKNAFVLNGNFFKYSTRDEEFHYIPSEYSFDKNALSYEGYKNSYTPQEVSDMVTRYAIAHVGINKAINLPVPDADTARGALAMLDLFEKMPKEVMEQTFEDVEAMQKLTDPDMRVQLVASVVEYGDRPSVIDTSIYADFAMLYTSEFSQEQLDKVIGIIGNPDIKSRDDLFGVIGGAMPAKEDQQIENPEAGAAVTSLEENVNQEELESADMGTEDIETDLEDFA